MEVGLLITVHYLITVTQIMCSCLVHINTMTDDTTTLHGDSYVKQDLMDVRYTGLQFMGIL